MRPEKLLPGLKALLAKELVEKHGLKRKAAAKALGLSPSAVTQYLQGARAGELAKALSHPEVLKLVGDKAERIALRGGQTIAGELLELALEASSVLQKRHGAEERQAVKERDKLLSALRARLQAEQEAAELFMRIAVNLKDDLARLLFRQIASDSIRHADIIMAAISAIEKGEFGEVELPSAISLERLIEFEEEAHVYSLDEVKRLYPSKILAILLDSIEADEVKHTKILQSLFEAKG